MNKPLTLSAALLMAASCLVGADQPKSPSIPADAEHATQTLTASPRHGEWVDIAMAAPGSDATSAATKLHTWVVYPERKDKAPVVLVIHEIFGLTDWVRAVADQLAAEGFIAVAPDLLSGKGPGGGNSDSFKGDEVRAAIMKLDRPEVNQRLDAARSYALKLPAAAGKSASIGFCWGGTASFNYATHPSGLNAAVVYYGTPPMKDGALDKDGLAKVQCPVLGLYGGNDARVTSTVESTAAAMSELKKSYVQRTYGGAGHGFLRQQSGGAPAGANLNAAQQAWAETVEFLKKHLDK